MDRETALHRYRLALGLVSDPTVAGELLTQARDQDHLRQLANRWRTQRGLEALTEDPPLPVLDEVDEGYALHLARQATLRRRVSGALLVLGAIGSLILAGAVTTVDSRMSIQQVFSMFQPAFGVAILVAGGWLLLQKQRDPAVYLLMGWGALLVVAGGLNTLLLLRLQSSPLRSLPRWWITANTVSSLVFWLFVYGTAAYTIWRLWPRQGTATPRSRGSAT